MRVCVAPTSLETVVRMHVIASAALARSATPNDDPLLVPAATTVVIVIELVSVSPIGDMRGETAPLSGLVPVEVLVSLGVANAGAATTMTAETSTSAARVRRLAVLMGVGLSV